MTPHSKSLFDRPWSKGATMSLLIALFAFVSWLNVLRHLGEQQWDFKIYYHAAKAWQNDQNPYDARTLTQLAQRRVSKGYAYPPATLAFFRPFTLVSYDVARHAFFVLKTLLVLGLIALWRKRFVTGAGAGFYLLCLFAFNNAIYLDLRAGNVSLIEQALLWAAFWAYTKDELVAFCLLVLLAASFKLLPLLFLGLLLIRANPKKLGLLALSLLGFAAFLGVSYLTDPALFRAFLDNASETNTESKILNPSTYAFCRDLVEVVLGSKDSPVDPRVGDALFVAIALAITAATIVAIRRFERAPPADRVRNQLFLACFLYALVVPRFKDYSYILLIVPAAYLLYAYARRLPASAVWLGVLCVPVVNQPMPALEVFGVMLLDYYPLLVAAVLWLMYLRFAREQSLADTRAADSAAAPPAPSG
jgi:glycosyl transferase family 87